MHDNPGTWTEADSTTYQMLASVVVPEREEQIATLLTLLPFDREETFTAVELGSGEGHLSETLLECFPAASVLALDGSEEMRRHSAERLERFGDRFRVEAFDMTDLGWITRAHGADCVLSSLCVHHLDERGKQTMFRGVLEQITPGGTMLIADLVEPKRLESRRYFAEAWDREVLLRSRSIAGASDGYEAFMDTEWNLYRFPDPVDQPSPLFEQLRWLMAAGWDDVDCFWMKAGHAIYGGYRAGGTSPTEPLNYQVALEAARAATKVNAR